MTAVMMRSTETGGEPGGNAQHEDEKGYAETAGRTEADAAKTPADGHADHYDGELEPEVKSISMVVKLVFVCWRGCGPKLVGQRRAVFYIPFQ